MILQNGVLSGEGDSTLTSHNGSSIPLKNAAGLNKDFLTACVA